MRAAVILLAAGMGRRLGRSVPKAFVPLAGKPMARYSLDAIAACPALDPVVLVVPEGQRRRAEGLLSGVEASGRVHAIVAGGPSRRESARSGVEEIGEDVDVILLHDAARPFATPRLFGRVLEAMLDMGAAQGAVPVVPPADTVKRVRDGWIVETLPRREVALAQTPQAFQAEALRDAHEAARLKGIEATDDAMLLEAMGLRVAVVPGEPENVKITSAEDLRRAEEMRFGGANRRGGST